jgi:hypothetical protein
MRYRARFRQFKAVLKGRFTVRLLCVGHHVTASLFLSQLVCLSSFRSSSLCLSSFRSDSLCLSCIVSGDLFARRVVLQQCRNDTFDTTTCLVDVNSCHMVVGVS